MPATDVEVWLGAAITLAWALVVIWSLGWIAVRAWRTLGKGEHLWDSRSFAAGLLVGAGLAGGVILVVGPLLSDVNTFGLGFLLALAATFVLWVFAKEGSL